MKTLALLLLMVPAVSACTTVRTLTIGTPSPVLTPSVALPEDTTWRLGELHVSVDASSTSGPIAPAKMVAPLKQQLADRVRATLLAQEALGVRRGSAKYALELTLEAIERYGLGKELKLAIALELGLTLLGIGVGTAIGYATSPRDSVSGAANGGLIGAGVGLGAAIGGATLPKSVGTDGTYKARVVLRRLSDRVPVVERIIESAWRCDTNFYSLQDKLAACSGLGFVDFEKTLLSALQDMLLELQPVATPPATP